MSDILVTILTIYDHPRDHPEFFVVRPWHVVRGEKEAVPGELVGLYPTIDEAREAIPKGARYMPRVNGDDEKIVENWIL